MPASEPGPRSCAPVRAEPSWLSIDVVFEDEDWPDQAGAEALIRQAAAALASHTIMAGREVSEACIALSNDAEVRTLNASYRGKDKPTNVLSFPASHAPSGQDVRYLGDIIIARETVEREAVEQGIPVPDHLRHLAVHGLLHLLGYDHETDEEAIVMESLETDILTGLGVPDPYATREDETQLSIDP